MHWIPDAHIIPVLCSERRTINFDAVDITFHVKNIHTSRIIKTSSRGSSIQSSKPSNQAINQQYTSTGPVAKSRKTKQYQQGQNDGFTSFSFETGRWTILRFGATPPAADDASCANALMVQSQGLAPLLGSYAEFTTACPPCFPGRQEIMLVHHRGFVANRVSLSSALLRPKHQSKRSWSTSSLACKPFSARGATTKICSGHWIAQDGHPKIPATQKWNMSLGVWAAWLTSSRRYYTNVKTLKVPHVVQVPIPGPPPKVITHKARNFIKKRKGMISRITRWLHVCGLGSGCITSCPSHPIIYTYLYIYITVRHLYKYMHTPTSLLAFSLWLNSWRGPWKEERET